MKVIYKLLLTVLLSSVIYAQNFTTVLTPYFKDSMRDIFFIDETTGWVCGNAGYIYATTDGGATWTEQTSGVTKDLQKVYFLNKNLGYIATAQGSALKTTDGGNSWVEYNFANLRPSVGFGYCNGLYFTNDTTGFIIAGALKYFYLFKTTDGGMDWAVKDSLITTDNTIRWYDINFYNDSLGVIVSSKKNQQKYTTDGGETWKLSTAIVDNFFSNQKAVKWLTPTTIISMGEGNEFNGVPVPIYKSTNGGVTWAKKNQSVTTCFDRVEDVYFKDSLNGIGVGSNGFYKGFVINTTDGGETWLTSQTQYALGFIAVAGYNNTIYGLSPSSHIVKSTDFGTTWTLLFFTNPTSITGMYFDNDKGFAMTRSGDFYVSNDGTGQSWEYLSNTGLNEANSMYFFNSTTGVILEENQEIVKTTDGGQTWRIVLSPIPYGSRNKLGGITFGDATTGYAWFSLNDYAEYHVFKSTDAGETWNQVMLATGPGYMQGNLVFFDANTGVLLGPSNYKMRTTDGGQTWDTANVNNFPSYLVNKGFEDVARISDTKAVAVGDNFICMTTDKGLNWNYIDHKINDIDSSFYVVEFSGPDTGYIGCFNGVGLRTTDGGFTWQESDSLKNKYYLYACAINKDGSVFFGTSLGYILGDLSLTGIQTGKGTSGPDKYTLSQNYPNPFNPITRIEYTIPNNERGNNSFVQLKIYDLLGREVRTLVNNYQKAGSYRVDFNGANLPSGVYFYRLQAGNYIQTRKLILMK